MRSVKPTQPFSFQTRLLVLFAAFSVVPLCVTNLYGYLQTRRELTASALQNASNVAALEAAETLEFARSRQQQLTSMAAGDAYLVRLLGHSVDPYPVLDGTVQRAAMHALLVAKAGESLRADELFVIDADGELLATSVSGPVDDPDPVPTCLAAAHGGRVISVVRHGEHAGPEESAEPAEHADPVFVGAVPIMADGQRLGVLCGRFGFSVHRELVRAHKERTTAADLYLLDADGRQMCGSLDDIAQTAGQVVDPALQDVVTATLPWSGAVQQADGQSVIAAFAPIPELGWGVLVEQPAELALASLERLKWQALGMGLVFIAAVVPTIVMTSRATAAPLRRLAEAAAQVADGATTTPVAESGARELMMLARSFNHMNSAIQDAHEQLERRIEQRTAELQRSTEFTELLLDSIDQRVLVVDQARIIVKANRAAIDLYGPQIIGQPCHGVEAPEAACPVCSVFHTGQPVHVELSEHGRRGMDILQVDAFPVVSCDGEVDAVVQIGRVVTAEKRLLAQTIHQEKMAALGLLAAGVAHEIGNPLASIQSQLRLLRDLPDSERARDTWPIVERQVQRISGLLRELSNLARRKRDEVVLVSVSQVVADVGRLLGHDPRARSVQIDITETSPVPGVRAKEDHLVQVLLNLGINAMDAMPGGGRLHIHTSASAHELVVRVSDTGEGVDASARERLFEPFVTTKDPGRGTGLGLFVSRSLIDGLGGRLELESTGPHGTVFAIFLPVEVHT